MPAGVHLPTAVLREINNLHVRKYSFLILGEVRVAIFSPVRYNSMRCALLPAGSRSLPSGGNRLRPLPVGSSLEIEIGVFRWSPGPGFGGEYRLIFLEKESHGSFLKKQIEIHIGKRKSG